MSAKVCFAYRWATYGGVERVFLNRALAFRACGSDVAIDIHYGADAGGLAPFRRAIEKLGLGDRVRLVSTLDPSEYDAVFVIDSPELIVDSGQTNTRWIVECHTPYAENRGYLDALPEVVSDVVVPSRTFFSTLLRERPSLQGRLRLLRNCVARDAASRPVALPKWSQPPVLYFGRLDELKNPQGLLDLLCEHDRLGGAQCMGAFLGPELDGYGMHHRVESAGLRGRVVRMPPLDFLNTGAFLSAWREARGIMVSPSWGESFGLAAAESIAAGVPVLLSRLPEHAELVGGDERHLYGLDDMQDGARKLQALLDDYDGASARMLEAASRFNDAAFRQDWDALLTNACGETAAA